MTRLRSARMLFLEGLMVVFSVLAALAVDEWREEAQLRSQVELASARLLEEVRQNHRELEDLDSVVAERRSLLRDINPGEHPGQSLAELVGQFLGYRTPDLTSAVWARATTGSLADHMPADLMVAAFRLYKWNSYFQGLDLEINRLVYGEIYYDPARLDVALAISDRIMVQQLVWVRELLPMYEEFLDEWGSPDTSRRPVTGAAPP